MAAPPRTPTRCPCGSREPYTHCCGALHAGRAAGSPTAQTPQQLMRSRFSAFAVGDVGYLLATWHASTRPASLQLDPAIEWRRLEVLSASSTAADEGLVEFEAHFWDDERRQHGLQRELSAFRREHGQWFYVDAAN